MRFGYLRSLAVVGLACAWLCGGCDKGPSDGKPAAGKFKRIILLTNGDDPFWDAMRAGMDEANKELKLADVGLKAELDKNDNTPKGQVDKLKQYASQTDIAAVGISVTDAKNHAIFEAMRALQAQGVKVITVDSDVDRAKARDARFAYIGTDNIIGGQELGKTAKGLRPDGGKYATFVGLKSAANAVERINGFAEGAGEKFEKLEDLGDDMDLSTAQKNVRDALDRHPELDTLVGIWAYNAHAIADTVNDRKIRDRTTVVVFDAAPKAIGHMDKGEIDAMVVQNPYGMGFKGIKLLKAMLADDAATIKEMFPSYDETTKKFSEPEGDIMITGLKVVVPDKGSPLSKEMFSADTQFLTISEFKAWLAKYGLKGS